MTARSVRVAAALLAIWLLSASTLDGEQLTGVRVHRAPEHTRIVFDLTGAVQYKVRTVAASGSKPSRLAVDLYGIEPIDPAALAPSGSTETVISGLRSGLHPGYVRVVLDLNADIKYRHFTLPPVLPYGDRIVIDLLPADEHVAAADKPAAAPPPVRDVVVAIDAGHGGVDPGAVGAGGILEKDVVFAIAKRIAAEVDQRSGFRAVLTREADYYVPLRKRTLLARQRHAADLLISVHADAFRTAKARGASVYALSDGGASSETARWLAQKENQADLVGGVSLVDYEEPVRKVLLDLSMDQTLTDSLAVGRRVLRELEGVTQMHSNRVEQAGFAVLKSPDVPSILIESGYLSNPTEARRLASPEFQQKLARAIARGAFAWFEANPPPGTRLARASAGPVPTL